MRCPLCGYEFDAAAMSCHSSCAFHNGCAIICCPNCGYQMTDESKSKAAAILRRLFQRPLAQGVQPLSQLRPGQSGTIRSVDARQEQLNVFGLIPGASVTLEQRVPAFVLRVGFTSLSLERDIADAILVEVG